MKEDPKKYKNLFLDRDGVINVESPGDYVKSISEFVFEKDVPEALNILSFCFEKVFIVTNQRGVGRGIMTSAQLQDVHSFMLSEININKGKITGVYSCTDTDNTSVNRKPNTGMAFQILRDYPDVDFSETMMVGNSKSDILFAKKLGIYSVLVGDKYPKNDTIYDIADAHYENLYKFALSLKSGNDEDYKK